MRFAASDAREKCRAASPFGQPGDMSSRFRRIISTSFSSRKNALRRRNAFGVRGDERTLLLYVAVAELAATDDQAKWSVAASGVNRSNSSRDRPKSRTAFSFTA